MRGRHCIDCFELTTRPFYLKYFTCLVVYVYKRLPISRIVSGASVIISAFTVLGGSVVQRYQAKKCEALFDRVLLVFCFFRETKLCSMPCDSILCSYMHLRDRDCIYNDNIGAISLPEMMILCKSGKICNFCKKKCKTILRKTCVCFYCGMISPFSLDI